MAGGEVAGAAGSAHRAAHLENGIATISPRPIGAHLQLTLPGSRPMSWIVDVTGMPSAGGFAGLPAATSEVADHGGGWIEGAGTPLSSYLVQSCTKRGIFNISCVLNHLVNMGNLCEYKILVLDGKLHCLRKR